jgi:16S rRNA (guanine527-N7)-methyltransferase
MDIILKYFPDLTEDQKEKFGKLQGLYEEWNSKINVVSRKDIESLYEKHVLHSLSIAKIINFKKGTEILDVGTGGGFPGIPLAIMFPDCDFYLIDSIGKKIHVVEEIKTALDLKNVHAQQIRAEKVVTSFDFIVSRAVTNLPKFMHWVNYKFHKRQFNDLRNGVLLLKGGDLEEEIAAMDVKKRQIKVYDIPDYFEEEFFETKKIVHVF